MVTFVRILSSWIAFAGSCQRAARLALTCFTSVVLPERTTNRACAVQLKPIYAPWLLKSRLSRQALPRIVLRDYCRRLVLGNWIGLHFLSLLMCDQDVCGREHVKERKTMCVCVCGIESETVCVCLCRPSPTCVWFHNCDKARDRLSPRHTCGWSLHSGRNTGQSLFIPARTWLS